MCRNRSVVLTLCIGLVSVTTFWSVPAIAEESETTPAPATKPTTGPTTGPTTAEAEPPPDQTTPKGAVKVLFMALEAGDVPRITESLYASNATEERMVKAIAEMAQSLSRMRQAAIAAFGIEGARGLAGNPGALADGLAQVDAAKENVVGNSATLQMGDATAPGGGALRVTRVGDQWRVPMAELAKDRKAEDIEANLEQAQIQKEVVEDIATELSAGKFKSAEEAMEAWRTKMMQAAMQRPQPGATQPAQQQPAPNAPANEAPANDAPAPAPTTAPADAQQP
jgi:hypothetical protein